MFTSCKSESKQIEINSEQTKLPNIILLVGDDQGYPYFGFMGADYVQTPHMDKLAASGTLFTEGYVPQNHCRPSLQTLMTGTLPINYEQDVEKLIKEKQIPEDSIVGFKHHAMRHFNTLPRLLAKKGYKSFQGGKWWEFNYQNGGFDAGMTKGWRKGDKKNDDWFLQFMGGDGRQLARATMQPVYDFVETNKNDPFFIWFAPELPHYPFDAPDKYYNIYKDKDMTESAKRYYANCTWFDDGVGELVRYLKEQGEIDNTLFVYVNDNGWEQEPHQEFRHDSLRWHNGGDKGKLSVYDQSFRTPIIFSWKDKIEAGAKSKALMHSADIPATILDYLDIDIPEGYFGKSYKSLIEDTSKSDRAIIIGQATQMRSEDDMMGMKIEAYWARTNNWFFQWNLTLESIALYDMNNDSRNDTNLAETYPEKVKAFQGRIEAWKAEHK
ncbi:sulfatase-like hydrolase/transferase [Ichthyenterobacterium sp. W332]|uniref:Sulfatase-like hydrolase/transferase n=1 Tax=Microcosmobacter mediterraneus TaxID=3075607 RepID=A0ABU2YII0_9FLAO|nr:sulfatase-like hydrolase/transferase [Ichthyenterobacterium sp. W332]MDT0557978.1 sulfatase-like hydrolase/transferase [Ichthyenterobacterium sp. W332]